MVASPEVCRMNGSKSRGPVSSLGKAIASRNATKHGLLAHQPPLLVTEDLATFEGLVQGLIDHYQPESPVEHFLIQQVAMGMLKQHRLWSVEAAIANIEILKAQESCKFPDVVIPSKFGNEPDFLDQRIPLQQSLTEEQAVLERLIRLFDEDVALLKTNPDLQDWLDGVRDSSGGAYFSRNRSAAVHQAQDSFDTWLDPWTYEREDEANPEPLPTAKEVVTRFRKLQKLARERIQEINQLLAANKAIQTSITQARIASQGMHQQDLVNRYQRNINRELYEALDRLEGIQQRRNGGSMGSFGQNPDLSPATGADSFACQ